MKSRIRGLYAVTPDGLEDRELQAQVEAALRGGAKLVQYRNKQAPPEVQRRQLRALLALCRRHDVPLIVNDDPRLAAEIGADGVHVGGEDPPVAAARAALGPNAIIGASCYDALDRAHAAREAGASYVAFGSVFPSTVKPDAVRAPLALLREAKNQVGLPVVAIGGITIGNAPQAVAAGADAIAVISALFHATDVCRAARELSKPFE